MDEFIWTLDRASGQTISGFGRLGHMAGEFTFLHTMAMNSKGDIFTGETVGGRRMQRFNATGDYFHILYRAPESLGWLEVYLAKARRRKPAID